MTKRYNTGLFSKIFTAVFNLLDHYFEPDRKQTVCLESGVCQAESPSRVRSWELNQGYEDIALKDIETIMGWLLPASWRLAINRYYNYFLIYFLTDEVYYTEENRQGNIPEIFYEKALRPKVLHMQSWLKGKSAQSTFLMAEWWGHLTRRLPLMQRLKNLLLNVRFLLSFNQYYRVKKKESDGFTTAESKIGPFITYPKRN